MKYKDELTQAMTTISNDKNVVFIGYNTLYGKAGGTLSEVKESQIIESPVAENLMLGMAVGMSLEGYIPIVYFERFDFILNAMDAIVNHLDKIKNISQGEFSPAIIIRIMVGKIIKPLFAGPTHTQDFTDIMKSLLHFPVISLKDKEYIADKYKQAHNQAKQGTSTMLIEYSDLYEN